MYDYLLLFAKHASSLDKQTGPGDKSMSLSWALVIFAAALGLIVTLSPARRTTEIKRPHEE